MITNIRWLITAALIAAAALGVWRWAVHLGDAGEARGAARVQAVWDHQVATDNEAASRDNMNRFRNAERVADEAAKRGHARQVRAAAAAAAVRGVHGDVAALNGRAAPYPPGDAGLAACTGEAATARELFAASADRYLSLAAAADELRDQVTGLLGFVAGACPAGMPTGALRSLP